MQKDIKLTEAQQGEVIAFYGDLTSVNPEDVDFKGSITEHKTVLAYVNEHKDNPHFTMMYPQANKSELFSGIDEQIREINPQTQFMQINSIEEFATYYDKGNREMDRELHPIESVKMLAHQDSLCYDVKERAQPVVEEKQVPREYVKAMDISSNEMVKDLTPQINGLRDISNQEFLDLMGLKGYDSNKEDTKYDIFKAKLDLKDEFIRDYALPQAGKTALDNIEHVIPSMPAKSMKEGVMDGIEFVHDLVGDKDPGHLKIEFECHNNDISDCHIKGVYREYEQDKEETKESTAENADESGRTIYEHESNITLKQESENDMVNDYNDDQGYGIGD